MCIYLRVYMCTRVHIIFCSYTIMCILNYINISVCVCLLSIDPSIQILDSSHSSL